MVYLFYRQNKQTKNCFLLNTYKEILHKIVSVLKHKKELLPIENVFSMEQQLPRFRFALSFYSNSKAPVYS